MHPEPYLNALRKQLEIISAGCHGAAEKKALISCHRMLTQLLVRATVLPALQKRALGQFDALLDELNLALTTTHEGLGLSGQLIESIRLRPNYEQAEQYLQRAVGLLARTPSPTQTQQHNLLQKIFAVIFDIEQGLHAAVLDQEFRPETRESAGVEPLDDGQKNRLQAYLRDQVFTGSTLEILGMKAILGGASKQTLIVELKNGKGHPDSLVLRIDKETGVTGSTVANEFCVIQAMHESGLPVPRPFAMETSKTVLGSPFMVVSHVQGHSIGDPFEVFEPSRAVAIDLARTLAKMHGISLQAVGDAVAGVKLGTVERLRQNIAEFESNWRAFGKPSIGMELGYAWLKEHIAFAGGRRAVLHCDVGGHNILVENDRLTALLDWETAVIGNPAQDMAYAHNMIRQMMPWNEFIDEYANAGGVIPSTEEMDFYLLWSALWRMNFLFVIRSLFQSERLAELLPAYASQHLYQRCYHDVHAMLNVVYERYGR